MRFRALIYREAGIYLSDIKKALLVGRLSRRLRARGLTSFDAYYKIIAGGDEQELVQMLDCICTNETQFFRETQHFDFLRNHVFPEWETQARAGHRQKQIRVWSAACSTGEEPYSLAMALADRFSASSGWQIEIIATDLSTRVLEQARAGVWPMEKAGPIPERYLKQYMLKGRGSQEGKVKAGPHVSSIVKFYRLNLNDSTYSLTGKFDLIFCRNVLIYFNAESKARVIDRMLDYIAESGYLFLGHSEALICTTNRARSVGPTVYALNRSQSRSKSSINPRSIGHRTRVS